MGTSKFGKMYPGFLHHDFDHKETIAGKTNFITNFFQISVAINFRRNLSIFLKCIFRADKAIPEKSDTFASKTHVLGEDRDLVDKIKSNI